MTNAADLSVLNLKAKGDLAELRVAADLRRRGFGIAIPFGEDQDFDLILIRRTRLERVQVKYTKSDGSVIYAKCRSHSLTSGKVRRVKRYTAEMIDWLAVFDATSDRCYYIPAVELGGGRATISLRLKPTLNGQLAGTRSAEDYIDLRVEPAGIEPATS